MQRDDWTEVAAEIQAAAQLYADAIFEPLAKQITCNVNEKTAEHFESAMDEALVRDRVIPAFHAAVFAKLGEKCDAAMAGWDSVYWDNTMERYHEGKP